MHDKTIKRSLVCVCVLKNFSRLSTHFFMEGFLIFPSFLFALQSNPLCSLSFEPQICETSFMRRHVLHVRSAHIFRKKSSHHIFENPKLQTLGLNFQEKKRKFFFFRYISSSSFWDPFNELEMTVFMRC